LYPFIDIFWGIEVAVFAGSAASDYDARIFFEEI
jgi:hypothetical protein